jgi:cytochrome bd ubiquinol oxidase subunit II
MAAIWFWIVAAMIAVYVVLDGFDLGAGIVHLGVARTDAERRAVLKTIGPVWDGNEVWLIAGGGALYFAFPTLYASALQGFYLPVMVLLWLLIGRGLSIELRNHLDNAVWRPFWDVAFCLASALLAVFFGAALGNVVRGVPLNAEGEFFLPLWTNFRPGEVPGILDWYTVLVAVLALLTLAMHGSLYLFLKTTGDVQQRAGRIARVAWLAVAPLTAAVTLASFAIQPALRASFDAAPAGYLFPLLALAGLVGVFHFLRRGEEKAAFLASSLFILEMMISAVFGLFPNVLPAVDPSRSLTIHNAASPDAGLRIGIVWFIPGFLLACGYFVFLYRKFAGKVETT